MLQRWKNFSAAVIVFCFKSYYFFNTKQKYFLPGRNYFTLFLQQVDWARMVGCKRLKISKWRFDSWKSFPNWLPIFIGYSSHMVIVRTLMDQVIRAYSLEGVVLGWTHGTYRIDKPLEQKQRNVKYNLLRLLGSFNFTESTLYWHNPSTLEMWYSSFST